MKTFSVSAALLTAISAAYAQSSQLTIISPPAVVQCQPVLLSWNGGQAPYYISVIPGGQASAAALQSFPTQSGNSLTWVANLASGQDITFKIVDSTGDTNYSSQIPIQAGSSTSCASSVSGGAAGGSASSSSAAAPASSSSEAAGAATTSRAPLSSSSSMATMTRSSSASSAASSSSAASTTSVSTGIQPAANSASSSPVPTSGASKTVASLAGVAGLAGLVAFLA